MGLKCSVDEDPTAEGARKHSVRKNASLVVSRVKKLVVKLEEELAALHEENVEVDDVSKEKLEIQATRLVQLGEKLGGSRAISENDPWPRIAYGTNMVRSLIEVHGFISESEARARYRFFQESMLVYYPIISFPKKLEDYDLLLQESPLLLLTCIYVTTVNHHGVLTASENRKLNQVLRHYVNDYLAHQVYIQAMGFSYHLVLACLILSLWCVPPDQVGVFKSQVDLITSFSVSLCMDVGNVTMYEQKLVHNDLSLERNNLRSFLGLYCCCGSIGFSLPRFKLVLWSRRHDLAILRLLEPSGYLPSRNDWFICYYARVIRVGQELFDYFALHGVSMHFLSSEEKSTGLGGQDVSNSSPYRNVALGLLELAVLTISGVLKDYEQKLQVILRESGFIEPESLTVKPDSPMEKYALLLTYYQIMMMTHDNLVSWCIYRLTAEKRKKLDVELRDLKLVAQHIDQFGRICEAILQCFLLINDTPTTSYPTFFFYRALHALISLIRLIVLVKSDVAVTYLSDLLTQHLELQKYYNEVKLRVERNKQQFDLAICERVLLILDKISKWVSVVGHYDLTQTPSIDFLTLTGMSKGQEIEKLEDPAEPPLKRRKSVHEEKKLPEFPEISRFLLDPSELARYTTNYSVQEIFKELDDDIVLFLNPFDTSSFDGPGMNFLNEYLLKDF